MPDGKENMKTIHIIGDSISIQYGPYLAKFIAVCCQYSRKEGVIGNLDLPDGANGGDSSMVLAHLHQCITERLHWDFLAINCGLHDIKRFDGKCQINLMEYEHNLGQIFNLSRELCNQIIWIRTTPVMNEIHNSRMSEFERYNQDVEKYNAVADKIALSNGAWIIDLNAFCHSLGGPEIYQDHVHFTTGIQKLQGAFIAGHINTLVKVIP